MIIALDVFGVVYIGGETDDGLNRPLLEAIGKMRQHGHRVVLASNASVEQAAQFGAMPLIADNTDAIYCSGGIGAGKPDTRFYAAITDAENVMPEDIMFTDDSQRNVEAALDFGWHAMWFNTGQDNVTPHVIDWIQKT